VASDRLKPEERVKVAMGMVDVVTQASAENKSQNVPQSKATITWLGEAGLCSQLSRGPAG